MDVLFAKMIATGDTVAGIKGSFIKVAPEQAFMMRGDNSHYPMDRIFARIAYGAVLGAANGLFQGVMGVLQEANFDP